MSVGTTKTFRMPKGWTVRKVAGAMAREWLPSFRAEPVAKAARWIVQSVMEDADKTKAPLWEPGIATADYEARLDEAELCWVIRASAGRGKGTILARFSPNEEQPGTFQLEPCQTSFPDSLFDAEKVDQFLREQGAAEADLFSALLASHGFQPTSPLS